MTIQMGLPFPQDAAQVGMQESRALAAKYSRRNSFRTWDLPREAMSKMPREWRIQSGLTQHIPDDLAPFVEWFYNQPEARERFRWALRDSLDELLDGQRTGRWAYQHLTKTEKTYLGTAVEVNLTREFAIDNGEDLDWSIAGLDIDCKFSKDLGGWEIPMEMYLCADHGERGGRADHAAVLTWMNDDTSQWAAGIVRITDERLRWKRERGANGDRVRAYNRDNKRKLSDGAKAEVYWLWGGLQTDLPTNLLRHLDPEARERILTASLPRRASSGQQRLNQLFREVRDQLIGRQTVLTVGQQDDSPKRARDARKHLRPQGIVVLGHQGSHPHVARALELPVPIKGEWISTRLVPVSPDDARPKFSLDGQFWARAREDELLHGEPHPAPDLPDDRDIDGQNRSGFDFTS
ncbi:NaeI family type II restriction endonuclease [Streptomyces chartreusis]|uniref:NaeI family type II restriction endonuclease n=1 Tax=Streptomyces chartreusis TaxID=1969 RepID=UPI002094154E|nr:NaeI family type II restriction endonuclease [Streptomyces chartreusis]